MASGNWTFFNSFKEYMADGTIDMDDAAAGAFKCLLLTQSYGSSIDVTDEDIVDLVTASNESSNYTRVSLTNVAWTRSSGTITWDADDLVFTASGGTLTAKYAVIYYDGGSPAGDAERELVCAVDLDTTSGTSEISVTNGNTLTLQLSANGIFTLS